MTPERHPERLGRALRLLTGHQAPEALLRGTIAGDEDAAEALHAWTVDHAHAHLPWASGIDVLDAAESLARSWADAAFEDEPLPEIPDLAERVRELERALKSANLLANRNLRRAATGRPLDPAEWAHLKRICQDAGAGDRVTRN